LKEVFVEKTVRSICQACHCNCGVIVRVEDGKVASVTGDPDHPMNRGFVCVKGRAQPDLLYHPDRLKYPLKRAGGRGEGKWQRVSWDDALDEIAERLTEVQREHGAESIAVMTGTGPRTGNNTARLLCLTMGTPNRISVDNHICFAPSVVAEMSTYGTMTTMMEVGPDYPNAECIVVWGGNPLASHPPRGEEIVRAKRSRGARLIVVDPRRTRLAAMADLWLQVRPGADLALALGMINVIIAEGLYDKEFVAKWCQGFDELGEHVRDYTPEKAAALTWLPAERIREAARLYATTRPAAFHHRIGVEHNINSTQTDRAFAIMVALTGNLDVKGGNLFQTLPEGFVNPGHRLNFNAATLAKRLGDREFPLAQGFVHCALAVEAALEGRPYPLKAMYCTTGNPVVNMQDSRKMWRALKNLDLLVVADFFMQPTAELADFVLPASTWLEKDDMGDFPNLMYTNYIAAGRKVIEPLHECRDDREILFELGRRIDWPGRVPLPWRDVGEMNEAMVRDMGISFKELQEKGYIVAPMRYRKYEEKGFNTPSGRVELYSTRLKDHGYDPLPVFHEPPESPFSTPELLPEYPLVLITGGRDISHFNTEGRQIAALRKLDPDPLLDIHPETAAGAGIDDGEWVWLETPQVPGERVRLKARLTTDVNPRVVHAPHGWWFPELPGPEHGCFDSNVNVVLSGDPPREPVCGSVRTRGTLCRVYQDAR
jgi:anaerobic selenocysteine-containing dehydrogenase